MDFSSQEIDLIMIQMDSNNDGVVDYREFVSQLEPEM